MGLPYHPCIKLNTDGSARGNPGIADFGEVFRDHNGNWIFAFSGHCGFSTSLKAELFAIYYNLQRAWNDGCRDILYESDSMVALELVQGELQACHPHATLIKNNQDVTKQEWNVSFNHTPCKANTCVDWLAKFGANHDEAFRT